MSKKYSASTGGFYDVSIHGNNIPLDAVDITDNCYFELLSGQSAGKLIIASESGAPVLSDPSATDQVPLSCTRRQGRLALLGVGKLATAEALISSIPDDTAKRQAEIEYEADTWERANPFLQQMWANLGGTSEELDALFSTAVTL